MRVLDIITESRTPLDIVNLTISIHGLSRRNHMPNQVTAIKQELSRHRLVTNFDRRSGNRTLGAMAWTGPIDEEWTDELDTAIIAWKRSINFQLSGQADRPLQNVGAPVITSQDLRTLQNTALGTDGLLDTNTQGGLAPRITTARGSGEGLTYRPGEIVGTRQDVENDPSVSSLVAAVGFSAWFRITAEMIESKRSVDGESWMATTPARQRGEETQNEMFMAFYSDQFPMTAQWLQNINRRARATTAVYADGTEQPIDVTRALSPNPPVPDIFDYYTNMARRLWEKDNIQNAEAQATADEVQANPVSAETLDEATLRSMAAQLVEGFANNVWAIAPGGRSFSNDVDVISAVLGRLRTSTDFDNFARIYSEVADGDVLHERLYSELSKEDYMSIVQPRLLAIRRIAPRMIHSRINFGDEERVEVEYEGRSYRVLKELTPTGQPNIERYNSENDYDAIIIDNILRIAVEQTGGTMPDFDAPVDNEVLAAVKVIFINTIQITYPEMVPFYIQAEPFDGASVDLGGMRMRGILDDAARMGDDEAVVSAFITSEIANDRDWLVGTDDQEPAANIRFDERYRGEGLNEREFPAVSTDQDVTLNANEEEIFENLKSTQASVVNDAVDALLQSEDPAEMWENIYRRSAAANQFLDESENLGSGESDILEFLTGSTNSNSPILRIATTIGLSIAAPRVCAKLFQSAIKGIGTTESTIDALIAQIRNRYDYELIDERYQQLSGVEDSLIDDLTSEQVQGAWGGGWYGQLAEIIGDERRLDLIRVELPRRIMDALEDTERNTTVETIQELRTRIDRERSVRSNQDQMEIIIDRLGELVDDLSDDTTPIGVALVDLLNHLNEIYDNL